MYTYNYEITNIQGSTAPMWKWELCQQVADWIQLAGRRVEGAAFVWDTRQATRQVHTSAS